MTGVVVYDSFSGNTKLVAEAIADELRSLGHTVDLRNVRQRFTEPPRGDFLFVGSPIRMGSVSGRAKRYVGTLDVNAWKGKPIIVFTTILQLPENATEEQKRAQEKWDHGAGRKLVDLARSAGLAAVEKHLWVEVKGMKGPIVEAGLESARTFAREILPSLRT